MCAGNGRPAASARGDTGTVIHTEVGIHRSSRDACVGKIGADTNHYLGVHRTSVTRVAVAMLTLVAFASGRASQPALARIANQDPDALLDRVETVVGKAVQLAKQNEIVFAATGGLALMTCSRHFTYSLLFLQSFKAAGWPIVRDGACELGESYRSARAAFKEELPELRKARALVPKLKEDVQQARALLESASSQTSALTKQAAAAEAKLNKWTSAVAKASAAGGGGGGVPRDAGELQAKLQAAKKAKAEAESALASATKTQQACIAKYAELRSRYAELSRVQNSVQAVSDALDPASWSAWRAAWRRERSRASRRPRRRSRARRCSAAPLAASSPSAPSLWSVPRVSASPTGRGCLPTSPRACRPE